ncbi:SLATT domain-containing protein [Paraburkholderia sp. ZP32-5]|uniref:SLATT domain-containing protein n=1 Tax=Paraburkholderia sp. ZP32-5 TaxID=2883245 RepID=UPI003FA3A531
MPNDNIWFTYKARIRAHDRLAKNDFHSQSLLVWYAFSATVLAILTIRYSQILGPNTDVAAAVLSTALLIVSMMVTGRDFRGRSIEMRRNYLALQALYWKTKHETPTMTISDVDREYERLLDTAENHAHIDDICARVFGTGTLNTRKPTSREIILAYGYITLRFLILTAVYLLPVLVTVWELSKK